MTTTTKTYLEVYGQIKTGDTTEEELTHSEEKVRYKVRVETFAEETICSVLLYINSSFARKENVICIEHKNKVNRLLLLLLLRHERYLDEVVKSPLVYEENA